MLTVHPRSSVLGKPEYRDLGVFKHPKWSPDGSQFFSIYMLELKETNTKIVKSALLFNQKGENITYVSEVGQHPMWYQKNSLLSYVRREGFDHFDNPSAQDIMEHTIDEFPGKPIVKEAICIHGSPSPDGKYFATDVFYWPEPKTHAVLLYNIVSGDYRVLARMKPETVRTLCIRIHPGHATASVFISMTPSPAPADSDISTSPDSSSVRYPDNRLPRRLDLITGAALCRGTSNNGKLDS